MAAQLRLFMAPSREPRPKRPAAPPKARKRAVGGTIVGINFERVFMDALDNKGRLTKLVDSCEYRIAEAERIGFTALKESWEHSLSRVKTRLQELSK